MKQLHVYQIRARRAFSHEVWVVAAPSLALAVEKAQKRLNRSPRTYEGFEIVEAELVSGIYLS